MTEPLTGGCLCGAVRYEISAALTSLIACHCTNWQRASAPEFLVVKAGGLDRHDGLRVAMNIWTRSRQPWTAMDATLEAHDGNQPPPR